LPLSDQNIASYFHFESKKRQKATSLIKNQEPFNLKDVLKSKIAKNRISREKKSQKSQKISLLKRSGQESNLDPEFDLSFGTNSAARLKRTQTHELALLIRIS